MIRPRAFALVPVVAFACTVLALAVTGNVGTREAAWIVGGVAVAFGPTGWVAPGGWRRRAAEALLVPLAVTLTMEADPTMRRMVAAPVLLVAAAAAVAAAWPRDRHRQRLGPWVRRGLNGVAPGLAVGLLALAPLVWWGVPPALAAPSAAAAAAAVAAIAAGAFAPGLAAGVLWFAGACLAAPPLPPPPDLPGSLIDSGRPTAELPRADGGDYVVEVAVANGALLPDGRQVATIEWPGTTLPLRAGVETAEWARMRSDVRDVALHALPTAPVWRPVDTPTGSCWAVAGRIVLRPPAGIRPRIRLSPGLPGDTSVSVASAGPAIPTPPRKWPADRWWFAAAVVVAMLQVASGRWRGAWSLVPWVTLASAMLANRLAVEPLHTLLERHSVDVALVAVLAAWAPAARRWLSNRRVLLASAAILLPLAAAAAVLAPPVGDQSYTFVLLDSLAGGDGLVPSRHLHLESLPYNRIYAPHGDTLVQSPVLAALLLPAYLIGGRVGANLVLAIGAAALVVLTVRIAGKLGLPARRTGVLASLLVLTYPLVTYATQAWAEVPSALATVAALACTSLAATGPWLASLLAVVATAMKTRSGLLVAPIAALTWWRAMRERRGLALAMAVFTVVAALVAAAVLIGNPLDPLGRRRISHLVPVSPRGVLTAAGGLAFDPAGGLGVAAPWTLVALAGIGAVWRRGSTERALIVGAGCTLVALLSLTEWAGGGSPPGRYLVPLLPLFGLGAAMVMTEPHRWRGAAMLVVPPMALTAWQFAVRPLTAFNPGDGGFWLADALAVRFAADARHYFPSFVRPSLAAVAFPLAIVVAVCLVVAASRRHPSIARNLGRCAVAVWLLAAGGLIVALGVGSDRIVELEDPQVARRGGTLEPPEGTFVRFTRPNGWRVRNGEGVDIPLRLGQGRQVALVGWLDGAAISDVRLRVRWDANPPAVVPIDLDDRGRVPIPPPPGGGRHRLGIDLLAPNGGSAVFDRLEIE